MLESTHTCAYKMVYTHIYSFPPPNACKKSSVSLLLWTFDPWLQSTAMPTSDMWLPVTNCRVTLQAELQKHSAQCSSGIESKYKFEYKYGLRSDLRATNFTGRACPQTPLVCVWAYAHTILRTPPISSIFHHLCTWNSVEDSRQYCLCRLSSTSQPRDPSDLVVTVSD